MATFVASAVVFGIVITAMALGVILQGRRLRGSCGGSGEACQCSPLAARHCPIRKHQDANG